MSLPIAVIRKANERGVDFSCKQLVASDLSSMSMMLLLLDQMFLDVHSVVVYMSHLSSLRKNLVI